MRVGREEHKSLVTAAANLGQWHALTVLYPNHGTSAHSVQQVQHLRCLRFMLSITREYAWRGTSLSFTCKVSIHVPLEQYSRHRPLFCPQTGGRSLQQETTPQPPVALGRTAGMQHSWCHRLPGAAQERRGDCT